MTPLAQLVGRGQQAVVEPYSAWFSQPLPDCGSTGLQPLPGTAVHVASHESCSVFSWSALEPAEGEFDFDWLDRVIELLHDAGILIDLSTPTASPPPWFSRAYPDSLPVTVDGQVLGIGARESFCPSSPDYRRAAMRIAGALAARNGEHPALARGTSTTSTARTSGRVTATPARRRSAPGCASATARSTRSTTPGHDVLKPGVRRLGGDHGAAPRADAGQPGPPARLHALLLRRVLLGGRGHDGEVVVPAGGVRVLRA